MTAASMSVGSSSISSTVVFSASSSIVMCRSSSSGGNEARAQSRRASTQKSVNNAKASGCPNWSRSGKRQKSTPDGSAPGPQTKPRERGASSCNKGRADRTSWGFQEAQAPRGGPRPVCVCSRRTLVSGESNPARVSDGSRPLLLVGNGSPGVGEWTHPHGACRRSARDDTQCVPFVGTAAGLAHNGGRQWRPTEG